MINLQEILSLIIVTAAVILLIRAAIHKRKIRKTGVCAANCGCSVTPPKSHTGMMRG